MTAAMVVVLAALAVGGTIATRSGTSGWTNTSLHVVGTPVVGGGRVVLLNVSAEHQLELTAVDPSTGSTRWTQPFSVSGITVGEGFGPVVANGVALDLAPTSGATNPNVTLKGIGIATGTVLWSTPVPALLSDAPDVCLGGQYFCVPVFASASTSGLIAVNATSGQFGGSVQGPMRNMAETANGNVNGGGLWQTDDNVPTFTEVSATGQRVWIEPVATLFGGEQYNPNYGWDFAVQDGLDVGSVGVAPVGNTDEVSQYKTVGIDTTNGSVRWTVPGDFDCGGGLQFLTSDVACAFSGSVQRSGTSIAFSGSLTLVGLNPATGASTWTQAVENPISLTEGTNVAFADDTHVVVELQTGRRVVLDTQDGSVGPIAANEVFWCEHNPEYRVVTPAGASANGQRQSAPVFSTCSDTGAPVSGQPFDQATSVGVSVDGYFIWPATDGLHAAKASNLAQA